MYNGRIWIFINTVYKLSTTYLIHYRTAIYNNTHCVNNNLNTITNNKGDYTCDVVAFIVIVNILCKLSVKLLKEIPDD